MEYFRIKNWEKYQHPDALRSKTMPWIKLDTCLFDDPKMHKLNAAQFRLWIKFLTVSPRIYNRFTVNLPYLCSKFGIRKLSELQIFIDLGLIEEFDASKHASENPAQIRLDRDKIRKEHNTAAKHSNIEVATAPTFSSKKSFKNSAEIRLENNLRLAKSFLQKADKNDRSKR